MKRTAPFANAIKKLRTVGYNVRRVARLVNDPKLSRSYYPRSSPIKQTGNLAREPVVALAP